MSKADGSVIIATIIDTEGVEKGTVEIKKELLGVGDSAEKANDSVGGSLSSGFKKLGKAIVAAGVIDMLVDFGKEAIELGSDLEEVRNVVDVTFTTMSKQVNKFAKDAQKTAGLSEKMAKQYVGTFGAMADSFGFTEQEAYEMSTALTQLTGDVASFYNLSQDEAMNKLKGVFTGETEALKELGVVMTQTALDSYAMANGFGKTTDAMSEQEKVALRYQFVMDQLSSASGDFVRTQEGWANQSRILSLQWESLMATIGTGLIDALSPSVGFLNDDVLPALQDAAEWMVELMEPPPSKKLEKSLKGVASSMEDIEERYHSTAEEIDATAAKAEIYRGMLMDLEETGLQTADAQAQYANIVARLNELYPDLNLQIDEHTGLINADSQAQLQNLDIMKERALMSAVEGKYADMLAAQATATMAVTEAQASLTDVQANRMLVEQQLTEATGLTIGQLYELDVAQRKGEETTRKLTAEEQALLIQLTLLTGEEVALNKTIAEGQSTIAGYDEQLSELRKTYGLVEESAEGVSEGQTDITKAVDKTNAELEELQTEYAAATDSARASIDSQIGLFDELVVKSDKSASDIVKNWESQQVALEQYKQNLEAAINMGLDEALVKQLSDGSAESMAILDEFVNGTDTDVEEINAAFRKTEESKRTVSATMADIQTDMSQKLNQLEKEVSDSWGDQAAVVKQKIQQMQKDINSLKGKTVTVTVVEKKTSSGSSSSSSSGSGARSASTYAARSLDVPYLAKGTVIPPNAPFMAVLGDQKRGTNIEAPLSTIQEAVANVMESAILSGFAAMVQEQKKTREAIESIEIGDTVIGEAVGRYNERNAIMYGGIL